jgi:hypothetical protein
MLPGVAEDEPRRPRLAQRMDNRRKLDDLRPRSEEYQYFSFHFYRQDAEIAKNEPYAMLGNDAPLGAPGALAVLKTSS